ncbi:MAG: biotin/lipoyl-containing protein [Verrucomicrobiota bacterium]
MSEENTDGVVTIEASVNSIFYAQSSPGEPPYVKEGDSVDEDTVVCLLEIMKCYRSVAAGVKGTVMKVMAENGSAVKKGDPLILVKPE